NTPPNALASIRDRLGDALQGSRYFLHSDTASVCLDRLSNGTSLGGRAAELAGRSVLIATRDQFVAALALIELDGIARRLIIGTPDLAPEHLPAIVAKAGVDAIVSDHDRDDDCADIALRILCDGTVTPVEKPLVATCRTEWVLLTSGTTGAPKMLAHSLATLTAPIGTALERGANVWGTFYDVRRYGGLQIFLRAVLGRGSLVLSGPGESLGRYLVRLGAHGATHVSGTPSHWRRALMSPDAR